MARAMKLLLVNPKFRESFWSFQWALDNIVKTQKYPTPPLGLATAAALSPSDWDIKIVDENIEPIDFEESADLVGVCGMKEQFDRQKEIIGQFKKRGHFVVAGGSYASLCPEKYAELVDTTISGEAEYILPEFCRDFLKGKPKKLYQETGEVQLADSPPPRLDLLKSEQYTMAGIQFSRGCPFQCEFCDIIVMFGRKPRTKSLEQIERELDQFRENQIHNAFFVDDNLIGHLPQCRKLLTFLQDYQKKHRYEFSFGTEASLNLAQDEKLMAGFKKANFTAVFIGIESPSNDSLLETKKFQNTKQDIAQSIHKIYSHGIDVYGGFIVGFDSDDQSIFERQHALIQSTGITVAMSGLLFAIPRTPLYQRLDKAGRLNEYDTNPNVTNTGTFTNVIPLKMSYDQLISGYRDMILKIYEEKNIYEKLKVKQKYLNPPPFIYLFPLSQWIRMSFRLFKYSLFKGGIKRAYWFLRCLTLSKGSPRRLAAIAFDWSQTLSMQVYFRKYFLNDYKKNPPVAPPKQRQEEKVA